MFTLRDSRPLVPPVGVDRYPDRVSEPATYSAHDISALTPAERVRLDALRYVANTEVADYIAIMRVFTVGTSGLMADLSAGEVAERLAGEHGVVLDDSTVEDRLSYLTTQGNLVRSPRETKARSIEEYLRTRARFQLTSTGELAHRLVEELLGATDSAREVSTEMLGAILAGLREPDALDLPAIAAADPDELAGRIATVFNQHRSLVESTREFYSYLGQVLGRYDLSREDFRVFKTVLIDYLTRFVDDIAKHMPQIGELLESLQPRTWSPAPTKARAWWTCRVVPRGGPPAWTSPTGWACAVGSSVGPGGNPTPYRSAAWPPPRCARWW